ncbi:MAG: hypothetical protein Q8Q24_02115 [bacterium]|nr:hypothetical protein [bacterium]
MQEDSSDNPSSAPEEAKKRTAKDLLKRMTRIGELIDGFDDLETDDRTGVEKLPDGSELYRLGRTIFDTSDESFGPYGSSFIFERWKDDDSIYSELAEKKRMGLIPEDFPVDFTYSLSILPLNTRPDQRTEENFTEGSMYGEFYVNETGQLGKSDLKSLWLGINDLEPGQFEALGMALHMIEGELKSVKKSLEDQESS